MLRDSERKEGDSSSIRITFTMNVQHVLLFCFTAALYPGNIQPVSVWTAAEGATASLACYHTVGGNTKFLCKNRCEAEDIIIKTENNTAQSGRFSIKFTKESSGGDLIVTFTRLTPSDAGLYRIGLGEASVPEEYCDIDVRVSDSPLLDVNSGFVRTNIEGETIVFLCFNTGYGNSKFLCRNDCNKQEDVLIQTENNKTESGRYSLEYQESSWRDGLWVTFKQAIKSDSGRYTCGYGSALSPDSKKSFVIMVTDAPTTSKPSWTSGPSVSPEPTTKSLAPTTSKPSWTSGPSVSPEPTKKSLALTTSKPSWTLRPGRSTSGPTVCPETTKKSLGLFWILVLVLLVVIIVVLVVVVMILYKKLTRRNVNISGHAAMEAPNVYEKFSLTPTCAE